MKIALINPGTESLSGMMPPLGLLWIAAILEKHNYDVKIFDIYPYNDDDLQGIVDFSPDVIGITILTNYWNRALHISKYIHKNIPDATFIAGGVHTTMASEETFKEMNADICVLGEGEYTMLELCEHLDNNTNWGKTYGIGFLNDNTFVRTPERGYIEDLDNLPLPARHLLDFDNYLIPPGLLRGFWAERSTIAMASRGCPFECIWCGSQCTFGRRVRRRSVTNVITEIKYLIDKYNIDALYFIDDTFTLNKKWVLEFCDELEKQDFRISWGCQTHVKVVEEDLMYRMKQVGLVQVDIGVESGSEKVLKTLKKHSTPESIKRAFKILKKVGIRSMATFIFGSPTETYEDVEATMHLAREIKPDYASSFFLTPYPGTELMSMAKENNWLVSEDHETGGLKKKPIMKINFSEKELYHIRARFQRMFIFRNFFSLLLSPRYIFRAFSIFLKYPKGFFLGLSKFIKTRVVDDFFFEFFNYYVKERAQRKKRERIK